LNGLVADTVVGKKPVKDFEAFMLENPGLKGHPVFSKVVPLARALSGWF
jgi:hypothetical protein